MKIAIPTENKIVVNNDPRKSGYFKVVTLKGEEIVNEEFRSNPLSSDTLDSPLTSKETDMLLTLLSDCDILIGGLSDNCLFKSRLPVHLKTIKTDKSLITCAVLEYYNSFLYNERNTCCSP